MNVQQLLALLVLIADQATTIQMLQQRVTELEATTASPARQEKTHGD